MLPYPQSVMLRCVRLMTVVLLTGVVVAAEVLPQVALTRANGQTNRCILSNIIMIQ